MKEAVLRMIISPESQVNGQLPQLQNELSYAVEDNNRANHDPAILAHAEQSASERYADVSVDELMESIDSMVDTATDIQRKAKTFVTAWRDGAVGILEKARSHREIMDTANATLDKLAGLLLRK